MNQSNNPASEPENSLLEKQEPGCRSRQARSSKTEHLRVLSVSLTTTMSRFFAQNHLFCAEQNPLRNPLGLV